MSNQVFKTRDSKQALTEKELQVIAGEWFGFTLDRIAGEHCYCPNETGEFVLLPEDDVAVIEGGKRYMVCRKCEGYSHL